MKLALPFPEADNAFHFIKSSSIISFCLLNSWMGWVCLCVFHLNICYRNYSITSIAIIFPTILYENVLEMNYPFGVHITFLLLL